MPYRTKTYIAGDWTGDKDLIDQIKKWNSDHRLNLHFIDAHELTQANDDSLPCSIKASLAERLNASKTFVLIVGKSTLKLTRGSCQNCSRYSRYQGCSAGRGLSYKSFIDYECDKAVRDGLRIIVIYNYANVDRGKCPESVRYRGTHINGFYRGADGKYYWNYQDIKTAIME